MEPTPQTNEERYDEDGHFSNKEEDYNDDQIIQNVYVENEKDYEKYIDKSECIKNNFKLCTNVLGEVRHGIVKKCICNKTRQEYARKTMHNDEVAKQQQM